MKNVGELFEDAILHWRDNKGVGTAIIPPPLNNKVMVLGVLQRIYSKSSNVDTIIVTNNFTERISLIEFLTQQEDVDNNKEFKNLLETKRIKVLTTGFIDSSKYEMRPFVCIMYNIDSFGEKMAHLLFVAKFRLVVLSKLLSDINDMGKIYQISPLLNDFKQNELEAIRLNTPVEDIWVDVSIPKDTETYKLLEYYNEYITTSLNIFGSFDVIQQANRGNNKLNISANQICDQIAKENGWNPYMDMSIEINVQIDTLYNPANIKERAGKTYEIIRNRSQLLSDYDGKLDKILEIVNENKDKKILIISKKGEFASKITDFINNMSESNICGNYHDKVEPIPAVDINGNPIYYKSGSKKGERKVIAAQAQKSLNEELFNLDKIRVLSANNSPDKELSCNIDILIITSPQCEDLQNYLYRLSNVYFNDNKLKLYNIYVKNSFEETRLNSKITLNNQTIINKQENNLIENNCDFIVVD